MTFAGEIDGDKSHGVRRDHLYIISNAFVRVETLGEKVVRHSQHDC